MNVDVKNFKKSNKMEEQDITILFTKVKPIKKLEFLIEDLVSTKKSRFSGDQVSWNKDRKHYIKIWGRTKLFTGNKINCETEYTHSTATMYLTTTPEIISCVMEQIYHVKGVHVSEEYLNALNNIKMDRP
jgi:hypothetical protein